MWIITAWQRISPEVIVKGFMMCCISNVMVGTDNDMLWNSSEDNNNNIYSTAIGLEPGGRGL